MALGASAATSSAVQLLRLRRRGDDALLAAVATPVVAAVVTAFAIRGTRWRVVAIAEDVIKRDEHGSERVAEGGDRGETLNRRVDVTRVAQILHAYEVTLCNRGTRVITIREALFAR